MKGDPNELEGARHICLSQAELEELQAESLGEKLEVVIAKLPSGEVTLIELQDLVGQDGLLLFTLFLTLVFMVPIQIPGLSVLFGCAIVMIGISRLRGRTLWLPKRVAQRALPAGKVRAALIKSSVWLHRLEYVSRPHRMNRLASTGLADVLNNGALIIGALLLMAPIVLVPFSNTLPALAMLFLCIGLLQRDGLCILYGHFFNLATVVYFTAIVFGGHAAFNEVLLHVGEKAS